MLQHTVAAVVDTRIWNGTTDPALLAWLGDDGHHFDGTQLVIHTTDGDMYPQPGWTLVRWPDNDLSVMSPRAAIKRLTPTATRDRVRREWDANFGGRPAGAAHVIEVLPASQHETAASLLKRADDYLSALHGSVARHDNLAANLACAGCELRDQIRAAITALDADTPRGPQLLGMNVVVDPSMPPGTVSLHPAPGEGHPDGMPAAPILAEQVASAIEYTLLPVMRDREARQETSRRATNNVLPLILPTTRMMAGLARDSEACVQRVTALYEQWVKAGPPRLGTSISREWDRRLAELRRALLGQDSTEPGVPAFSDRPFRSHRQSKGD